MSKDSSSRKLLGTIKFVFDKTKSRTLNATQAYDTSTSQIVLASYPATSTIKGPTKGPGKLFPVTTLDGYVGVNAKAFGAEISGLTAREKDVVTTTPKAISLGWTAPVLAPASAAKKIVVVIPTGTAQFSGAQTLANAVLTAGSAGDKSNATKEIFAGNITVGTGLYRDWQNKYAVLKVDLLTDKAILRVYNE